MLKMAGVTTIGLGYTPKVLARLADGTVVVQDHIVPADKHLTAEWKRILVDRGTKEIWKGDELESIGMPIGGIAAGQMYLCGDGTLGCWEIFNRHDYQNVGPYSYAKRPIPHSVKFGFEVQVDGQTYSLDKKGFANVTFNGQHPIAIVTYDAPAAPVKAQMTAYTPFIPMNAKDSALPTTVFEIEITNVASARIEFNLRCFLENACGRLGTDRKRHSKPEMSEAMAIVVHSVEPIAPDSAQTRANPRPDVILADFEGNDYGAWTATGEAFGRGPAKGTLADQNPVTNFVGKGLVNSFLKGDGTVGRLTSPSFTVDRDFINFKIGGGNRTGMTCINLLVGGKVVRTATGLNSERLEWESWHVAEFAGKPATIEIVDEATGGWGHINIDQITHSDRPPTVRDLAARHGDVNRDTGSLAIAVFDPTSGASDHLHATVALGMGDVSADKISVDPGASRKFVFVLGWHFPHHTNGRNYANFFADAGAVAQYVVRNHERLAGDTKRWRDTFYDSTLPYWLLDRLHSTVGNLATGTTEWWKSGRFWSWEGVVCCSGTCTHVWNYEHSMARLFPEIERNVRTNQDYGAGFDAATGLVGFRSDREYAADGQCGTVLKAYREHLVSADDHFLRDFWPRIKKSLEFLIKHDANGDGMIEDAQPNTYDIDFFGANTFVGSLYLAALRAGESMASEMGDTEFAAECHRLYLSGRAVSMKRLFNGEYFIQEVDQTKYKEYQYGPGCLADQLFGQGWAHQVGLGHIYPRESVTKALQSVWKYNWAPDVAGQNKRWPPQRPFALPGEGGLFTCTWPIGGREKDPVLYRDEVWTGIEYQVAGHMIWEGMVEEGLAICRAVHERYHPAKRNPYNEVECSDHYSRAMASWGVLTALSGFSYHGPAGRIGFAPAGAPSEFKSAFTTAAGWGTYAQTSNSRSLSMAWGQVRLTELSVPALGSGNLKVTVGGRSLPSSVTETGAVAKITFTRPLTLKAGQKLEVKLA